MRRRAHNADGILSLSLSDLAIAGDCVVCALLRPQRKSPYTSEWRGRRCGAAYGTAWTSVTEGPAEAQSAIGGRLRRFVVKRVISPKRLYLATRSGDAVRVVEVPLVLAETVETGLARYIEMPSLHAGVFGVGITLARN